MRLKIIMHIHYLTLPCEHQAGQYRDSQSPRTRTLNSSYKPLNLFRVHEPTSQKKKSVRRGPLRIRELSYVRRPQTKLIPCTAHPVAPRAIPNGMANGLNGSPGFSNQNQSCFPIRFRHLLLLRGRVHPGILSLISKFRSKKNLCLSKN